MRKIAERTFLILFILLIPIISWGEIKEGSFEINPYAGFQTLGTKFDYQNRAVYGLRLGYNITKNIGVEVAYDRVTPERQLGHVSASLFHGDIIYHFMPDKAFNPFIVAGVGGGRINPKNRGAYNSIMGDIGVGFKYFFNENIAFRADVRDVMLYKQNVAATAGLVFAFGGKKPQPVQKEEPVPPPPPPPPPPAEEKPVPPPPPPPPPAPAPEPVKIILEDIHFDYNKATLTSAAIEILGKNIKTINDNPGINVQIEGNTCAHGSEEYNMALSERRANAVKEYLEKGGISSDRMTTISYGETKLEMPETPTLKNKDSNEASTNRRVHFVVIVK